MRVFPLQRLPAEPANRQFSEAVVVVPKPGAVHRLEKVKQHIVNRAIEADRARVIVMAEPIDESTEALPDARPRRRLGPVADRLDDAGVNQLEQRGPMEAAPATLRENCDHMPQ